MSDTHADSTLVAQEQSQAADSPANGQEQGEQSRVNGLMALANKRLAERDAALAEIVELKARLNEVGAQFASQGVGQSQRDLKTPPAPAPEPEPEYSAEELPRVIDPNAAPRRPFRPMHTPDTSSPSARFQQDRASIEALKRQLNTAGVTWARANGYIDAD